MQKRSLQASARDARAPRRANVTREIAGKLLRLAAPVAVSRLGVIGMGIVDMTVVGQLAPAELAHQALGWTISGPALIGGIGLLLGVQVLTARAVGAGQTEAVGSIWRRGIVIGAVAGALIWVFASTMVTPMLVFFGVAPTLAARAGTVASVLALSIPFHLMFMASTHFLEALQRPVPGAIVMWAGNLLNLALNLALVPPWGAVGSAWATVSSRAFLAAAIIGYLVVAPALRGYVARPAVGQPRAAYRALLAIGVAAAVSGMVEAGAFASMSVIAGRIGATAVATFSIATGGIVTLVYLFAQGFATAGGVLVADAMGAGTESRATRAAWYALAFTTAAMAVCGVVSFAFAGEVARAFTADAAVVASLAGVMGLVALLMTPDGGQGVADAVLRARGFNWYPTLARMLPFVLIAPPLGWWLAEPHGHGIAGVIEALLVASFVAYAALLLRLTTMPGRAMVLR